jgi:glycosyltransferase involved in cell wall biosynthesis
MAAFRLLNALLKQGIDARMLVKEKDSVLTEVHTVAGNPYLKAIAFFKEYSERLYLFTRVKNKKDRFNFSLGQQGMSILKHPLILEADVIHLHWINKAYISIETLTELGRMGKKLVWTFHDMWAFTGGCHYSGNCDAYQRSCGNCPILKGQSDMDLSKKGWKRKRQLYSQTSIYGVTCSSWLQNLASQSSLWAEMPLTTINNPIDTEYFKPEKVDAAGSKTIPVSPFRLLFLARDIFDHRKGLDLLIAAIKSLLARRPELKNRLELILAGENKGKTIETPIKATYTGFITGKEQVKQIYLSADTFILPSREDNLPNTLVEASACGLPSIAYRVGGIPEMIEHEKTGYLVTPESVEALSNAIESMVTLSNEKVSVFRKEARELALRKYSPLAVAKKYIGVYSSMLNQ